MTFVNKIPTLKGEQFSQEKGECPVQEIKPFPNSAGEKCLRISTWPSFGAPCPESFNLHLTRYVWGLHQGFKVAELASFKPQASNDLVSGEGDKNTKQLFLADYNTHLYNMIQYTNTVVWNYII